VDVSAVGSGAEAVGHAADAIVRACDAAEGRLLAARVRLVGRSAAHESLVAESERWDLELREAAGAAGRGRAWLEKIEIATQRLVDLDAELSREDALGDLLRSVVELEATPELLARLGEEFADLARKLPPALREGEDGFDPKDPEGLRRRVPAARDLLLSRLLDAGGEGA
jgi:hypothetical protein